MKYKLEDIIKNIDDSFWDRFKTEKRQQRPNSYGSYRVKIIKNYLDEYCEYNNIEQIAVITEEDYVDKNWIIDYAKYYSRCFEDIDRFTKKYHFFKNNKDDLLTLFKNILFETESNSKYIDRLNNQYIGFFIEKPTESGFIGKTVLDRYNYSSDKKCLKVTSQNYIHLFGIGLTINSLPFLEQDRAVGACATSSIWSALHALNNKFGVNSLLAPSEITERAFNNSPHIPRKFPNRGLNIKQMLEFFHGQNFEISKLDAEQASNDLVEKFIKTYSNYGLPIFGLLEIGDAKHSTIITGYKNNKQSNINKLYVHDDQIGPYARTELIDGNITEWKNEWTTKFDKDSIKLTDMIVPLYHKIRLNFTNIYLKYYRLIEKFENKKKYSVRTFLTDINRYKKNLREDEHFQRLNEESKSKILLRNMEKYFFIVRINKSDKTIFDLKFDATREVIHEETFDYQLPTV